MKIHWKLYSLEKAGNREDENEDAGFPLLHNGANFRTDDFSCALADGATQASFSKNWAEILVKKTGSKTDIPQKLSQYIETARDEWEAEISKKQLSWPAEIKVRQGAFCTYLWLHLMSKDHQNEAHQWESVGIGDSCLFHFRHTSLLESYPLTRSDAFDNTPELISTNLTKNIHCHLPHVIKGSWQYGDDFLLATDAMSAWILNTHETGHEDVYQILKNRTGSRFDYARWISALRNNGSIKNDDTTLIWLSVTL
jgi:serine/threonine protein phosphatase PrpC